MSAIRRGPRPQRFDILDQRVVRDQRLSYRARGVLVRLLSNADDYSMSAVDLAREGKEGRASILSALKELRLAGYVITKHCQDERGRWRTESVVCDVPQPVVPEKKRPPKSGNRTSVSQTPENRMPVTSTLTEQEGEQPKKNNNSVGCCVEAQTLILSSPARLTYKEQQFVQKSLAQLQPDLQIQLLNELIRQRSTIANATGWMVKMVKLAKSGGFTPSSDTKQFIVHASHLPGLDEALKVKEIIENGKEIWQRLDSNQRHQVAVALEKHLVRVDHHGLSIKQLRKYGIEHSDVARDLYIFLAENHKTKR